MHCNSAAPEYSLNLNPVPVPRVRSTGSIVLIKSTPVALKLQRHRTILQTINLIQAARLIARGHQKNIGARFNLMRAASSYAIRNPTRSRITTAASERKNSSYLRSPVPCATSTKFYRQKFGEPRPRSGQFPSGPQSAKRFRPLPERGCAGRRPNHVPEAPACTLCLPLKSRAEYRIAKEFILLPGFHFA